MARIGSLSTSLTLESQSFFVELARVNAKTQSSVLGIQKSLSKVATGFTAMFSAIGGSALLAAGKRALDYAGSLGEVSQQLGVTSRDLQLFRFVGSQVGVENAEMDKGLQKLTRTMGEADAGAKKQAMAFRELGVSVRDSRGQMLTAGQVLPKLADALAKIKDPATRARYEVALFGKTGQQLDPLLTQGAQGVAALTAEAERLGIVIGDDLIAKADAASDKLAVLAQVLESQLAVTVAENADAISALADEFMRAANAAGVFIRSIRGTARIAQEEGFIAALGETNSVDAATPQGWFDRKQRQLIEAQKRLRAQQKIGAPRKMLDILEADVRKAEAARDKASGELMTSAFGGSQRLGASTKGDLPTHKGGGSKRGPKDRTEELAARREALRLENELARAEAQGDEKRAGALREQIALQQLTQQWVSAGLSKEEALAKAAQQRGALMWDTIAANMKSVAFARDELSLADALADRDFAIADLIQNQIELRERIVYWQSKGLALAEATAQAEQDLSVIQQRRLDERAKSAAADERRRQIELARARGENEARIRQLEEADWIESRAETLGTEGRLSEAKARAQAEREALEMNAAYAQGFWRNSLKDGFRAALDGDFGGWFENWWKERLSSALEDALNSVADLIAQLFKVDVAGAGGGGNPLASLFSMFGGGGGGSGLQGAVDGMRAGGGAVLPGRTYWVGEQGPEPFTPNRSGFITPARANSRQGRGNVTIYANDAVLASTVRQWVTEGMFAAENGAVARSARANHRQEQRRLGRR